LQNRKIVGDSVRKLAYGIIERNLSVLQATIVRMIDRKIFCKSGPWRCCSISNRCDGATVRVQLPASADNVTLLKFSAERRAAVAPGGRRCRSIFHARRAHSSKRATVCIYFIFSHLSQFLITLQIFLVQLFSVVAVLCSFIICLLSKSLLLRSRQGSGVL